MKLSIRPTLSLRVILQALIFILLIFASSFVSTATAPVTQRGTSTPTFSRTVSRTSTPTRWATLSKTSSPISTQRSNLQPAARVPVPLDVNTIAMYRFDSASDGTTPDEVGNFPATLHGDASILSNGLYAGVLQTSGLSNPGSYARVVNLPNMLRGTIDLFIDFSTACYDNGNWNVYKPNRIFSIGGDYGSGQIVAELRVDVMLFFRILTPNGWYRANSAINPCRYLVSDLSNQSTYWYLLTPQPTNYWPYEAWRYHHVAVTWGERGMEIWVDGVLHGVGFRESMFPPEDTLLNPPQYTCNPQAQLSSALYPACQTPVIGPHPDNYTGGITSSGTLLVGCESDGVACFNGRFDELRISNIQRTFSTAVVPTSTPTATATPQAINGAYTVDAFTMGLYHYDSNPSPWVALNADSLLPQLAPINHPHAWLYPQAAPGRYGTGITMDGNLSYMTTLLDSFGVTYTNIGTVETWVKLDSVTGPFAIINAGSGYETGEGPKYDRLYLGMPPGSNTLMFGLFYSDETTQRWYWANSGINPSTLVGAWHHVAGTWGSRGLEIWIDGTRYRSTPYYGGLAPIATYMMGCDSQGNCMRGMLDETRLSKIQRTFAPIATPTPTNTPVPTATWAPFTPSFWLQFPFIGR